MKRYQLYVCWMVLILLFVPQLARSTKYTIVKLVPNTLVPIGEHICGIGDTFDDRDTIFWNNEDTLIMNVICNSEHCYTPKQTIFYPRELLAQEPYQSLYAFLAQKKQALAGYQLSRDTLHVLPSGQTSLNLFTNGNLYAHIACTNYMFEVHHIDNQYFISYNDFSDHTKPITLDIYSHPSLKSEYKLKSVVVVFSY